MQSNQNTFRLGRLSHTSDFRKQSISQHQNNPKQTLKLAALTSITRGVKYNDLSFITGRQLPKLRKQPQQIGDNLQYNAAHDNLTSIRKKHDNITKQKLQLQGKVKLLKQQKQKYLTTQDQFLENKNQGNQKVIQMNNQLNKIKSNYEEAQWAKKVYSMQSQRIKTDKIIYDQRKYNLQKQLDHLKKQLKIFVKQGTGINQNTDRTAKVYQKLIKQIEAEQNQRQSHISNIQHLINQKQQINHTNQIRKNQIQQIAAKASQDKDQSQKNWIHILHVHKFVDQLLRNKMNSQMEKFFVVETAFKNIKIATGVSDAQTLISKYLNKETVYGQLLGKIADNQRRMAQLKAQNQNLIKERKLLKEQKRANENTKKPQIHLRKDLKMYQQISQKHLAAQLNSQKIRSWIIRNFKKIFGVQKKNNEVSIGKKTIQIGQGFKKYLQNLQQQLNKSNKVQLAMNNQLINSELMSQNSKVFRVKPKSKKINLSGQEIQNQFQQEDIQNAYEQQDVITHQRSQIIKQNQKFMKQLKRKMEQIKKTKLESVTKEQTKKKATTSPEKKPAQDQ